MSDWQKPLLRSLTISIVRDCIRFGICVAWIIWLTWLAYAYDTLIWNAVIKHFAGAFLLIFFRSFHYCRNSIAKANSRIPRIWFPWKIFQFNFEKHFSFKIQFIYSGKSEIRNRNQKPNSNWKRNIWWISSECDTLSHHWMLNQDFKHSTQISCEQFESRTSTNLYFWWISLMKWTTAWT